MSTSDLTEQLDGALLLIARGASTAEVGAWFEVSGRTVERVLSRKCPEAYRECVAARSVLADNHGTRGRYAKGCRCARCNDFNARASAARRARKSPPAHGTKSGYVNHNCPCDACRAAGSEDKAARRQAARAAG